MYRIKKKENDALKAGVQALLRDRISAAIIALDVQGEGAKISWTTADNEDAEVTAQDLRMIIAAVAVRSNALHTAYRVAKAQVEAAVTADEVRVVCMEL